MKPMEKRKPAQLKQDAVDNTAIVYEKKGVEKEVLKEGRSIDKNTTYPNEQYRIIGTSLGVTRNVGDYESLRADAWISSVAEKGWEAEEITYLYVLLEDVLDTLVTDAVDKIYEEKKSAR